MSASPAEAAPCPRCGADVPDAARFCPSCGERLEAGSTAVIPPPPDETGRVPVSVAEVEPHLFGVTPRLAALVLALAALALGVLLLVLGHLVPGLVLLVGGLLLVAAFVAAASRGSHTRRVGDRVRFAATAVGARTEAAREATRLRHELARLEDERSERLRALGAAAFAGEETEGLRAELAALDERVAALRHELQLVAARAHEQVTRARLEVQPTELVEPPTVEQPAQD